MGAHVGAHICANQTLDDDRSHPGREWSLHCPPQKAAALWHTAGLAGPPCSLPCHVPPTGWGLPCSSAWMLVLTDVPSQTPFLLQIIDITHRVTVSALPGTNRDTHGTSLCPLGNLHQQLLPKDASGNEGPAEPGTTLPLPWQGTVPSQFLCPPMPKSFFKTLHAELMEKGNFPFLPKGPRVCIYAVLLWQGRFHSLPSASPFFNFPLGAKSRRALGDARALTGSCSCCWLLQE